MNKYVFLSYVLPLALCPLPYARQASRQRSYIIYRPKNLRALSDKTVAIIGTYIVIAIDTAGEACANASKFGTFDPSTAFTINQRPLLNGIIFHLNIYLPFLSLD